LWFNQKVAPLRIRVSIVLPKTFRTGFAGRRFRTAVARLVAYDGTAGAFRQRTAAGNGQRRPAKAARATLQAKIDRVQQALNAGREVVAGAVDSN
jgi:hypothetical protein